MGSASREALVAARAVLNGPLSSLAGGEVLAASALIGRTPALLSALGEASATAEAKRQLVERVFGSSSVDARRVLAAAAEHQWSNAAELVAGIEELGLRAVAIGNPGLADELLAAAGVIDSDHELELTLGSKLGDDVAKGALVERLFTGRLSAGAVSAVSHYVANLRGRKPSAALREAARLAADQGGSELATVTVASPLSDAQQTRLAGLLEKSAGRPVRVTTVIDPSLVGGVRIQIGDDVIDGSIRSRLDDLRLQLAG